MQSFKTFNEEYEYNKFVEYANQCDILSEIAIPSFLKSKIDFVKELADKTGAKLKDVFKIFKDKQIFKFMSKIGWSIGKLFNMVKEGGRLYHKVINSLTKEIANSKIGKRWEDSIHKIEAIVKKHPLLTKMSGIAVGSVLAYIWFNMTFTGSLEYDFNMSDMLNAIAGNFSLVDLFTGEEGIKLLMLFVTGKLGLSFPWPGASSVQFMLAVIVTLGIVAGIKIKNKIQ